VKEEAMLPRNTSDYRTLFWALVLFPLVPAIAYAWPAALPWLLPVALYTSYCSGVLTHNHTHVPVFTAPAANTAFGMWLSVFYGCPIAFWIPTHLENHHRYLDGPEDVTRTSRRAVKHDVWQALVYSAACANWQRPLIASYVRRAYARGGRHWRMLVSQSLALVLAHGGMLALALSLHGALLGLLIYALTLGLPAAIAPSLMFFTNYVQHVHCDPASPDNHSRNFVSRSINWFVFDGGYHTVHHERPSTHWSHYAGLHRARAGSIDPSLCQHSILSFCVRSYVLGVFAPRLRTRPLAAPAAPSAPARPARAASTQGLEHESA
jgi:beta-carotene hydroxylase